MPQETMVLWVLCGPSLILDCYSPSLKAACIRARLSSAFVQEMQVQKHAEVRSPPEDVDALRGCMLGQA